MAGPTRKAGAVALPRFLKGTTPVCPSCTGVIFRPAEANGRDGLLRLVGLTPVRCVNCAGRFYRPGPIPAER